MWCLCHVACWSILVISFPARARGGSPEAYVFEPDTSRVVLMTYVDGRGHVGTVAGHLDAAGNFLLAPRELRVPEGTRVINDPAGGNEETVYEYRSGRLIKGKLDNCGNFKPERGSRVIPMAEYQYSPTALRIYNLPGRFVPKSGTKDK